jgi:DNA polymerase III alpha subunit
MAERKKNGIFLSYDNFCDRCQSAAVNKRTIQLLKDSGALEFNKRIYISRVVKYNSSLVARA